MSFGEAKKLTGPKQRGESQSQYNDSASGTQAFADAGATQ